MSFLDLSTDVLLYSCHFFDSCSIVMLLETCKTMLNLCKGKEFEQIMRNKPYRLNIGDFTLNELLLYAKSYQNKPKMDIVNNYLIITTEKSIHHIYIGNYHHNKYNYSNTVQTMKANEEINRILSEEISYCRVCDAHIALNTDGSVRLGSILRNVRNKHLCEKIIHVESNNIFVDRNGNCFKVKQKDRQMAATLTNIGIEINMTIIKSNTENSFNRKVIGKNIVQKIGCLTLDNNGQLYNYNLPVDLENVIQITDNNFVLTGDGQIFKINDSGDLRKMNINLGKIKQICSHNTKIQLVILTEDGLVYYFGKELKQEILLKDIEEILTYDDKLYALGEQLFVINPMKSLMLKTLVLK